MSALAHEIADLRILARRLEEAVPAIAPHLAAWHLRADSAQRSSDADEMASQLRRLWLAFAHETAQSTTRTPLAADRLATPSGAALPFGYERELSPDSLEARAAGYLRPPANWTARHLLFGSGQSVLGAVLLHVAGRNPGRRIRAAHIGSYFETRDLLRLFGAEELARTEEDRRLSAADLAILEPTMLAESFRCLDIGTLAQTFDRHGTPPFILIDATLSHLLMPMEDLLGSLPSPTLVIRMASMLKLDQAGLELANAGLLSVFAPSARPELLKDTVDSLATIRGATGTGLAFADVCALDVPWFLDASHAGAHARGIFENNRRLARRLKGHPLFSAILHPALDARQTDWSEAPFVVLKLHGAEPEDYQRLGEVIESRAQTAGLLLRRGGSFGFRTHRFEIVEPEGEPPFLRVALGSSQVDADAAIDLLACLQEGDLAT